MVITEDNLNYFNRDNLRHAYLLETNNFNKVLNIAKHIFNQFNTEVKNLDLMIENGLYPDLKIIEPDGQWIKKEQVYNLKGEFKSKSSFNNKRIYIIKNAENLNKNAANTILKFLEEPEENIVALLITTNKSKVLDTIVSRCQYIVLDSNKEKVKNPTDNSLQLYNILEEHHQRSGLELFKILEGYGDRNSIKEALSELVWIYEQTLLIKLGVIELDSNKMFDKIVKNNTIEDIQKRINSIIFAVDSLEYNVNLKLLVDKLIISMFGVD
ncbi:MAG: hypothetical protein IJO43_04550 [Bacilli bacterium]|nr:hypothetical protein [Bacilli bacterium]